MLTAKKISQMILEINSINNVSCIYDFKERYNVSLSTLRTLDLVTSIRSKIPACDSHCSRYQNCDWVPTFQKRKSKSKFKLSKTGQKLVNDLSNNNQDKIDSLILNIIKKTKIVDIVQSLLLEHTTLTVELIITEILKQTKINLQTIRITLKDILDLLSSLNLIKIQEGIISSYG